MVISTVNQVVYNGDGVTTAFPFTFRIIEATDIKLLLIDADGAETDISADYYVDTVNNTVYYPGYAPGAEPPAEDQPPKVQTGQKLVVYRELPITQEKDLGEKWPFYVIELGLDKLTMILQQIFDWWGRTLKISQGGSVEGFDTNIYPEAGKVISVNEAGDGFTGVTALLEENNAWEGKGMQIHNIAGPSSVTDAVTKDYVDQILNGFVLAGDSRTVPVDTLEQLRTLDIEAGRIAFTLGYHDVNDGGAGVYAIRTAALSDVDDGGSIIILDNGNVAELIMDARINAKQFGCYCDGTHDDTTAFRNAIYAIGKVINNHTQGELYVPGKLRITERVIVNRGGFVLKGDHLSTSRIICDGETAGLTFQPVDGVRTIYENCIRDISVVGNESNTEPIIEFNNCYNVYLYRLYVAKAGSGVYDIHFGDGCGIVFIDTCTIDGASAIDGTRNGILVNNIGTNFSISKCNVWNLNNFITVNGNVQLLNIYDNWVECVKSFFVADVTSLPAALVNLNITQNLISTHNYSDFSVTDYNLVTVKSTSSVTLYKSIINVSDNTIYLWDMTRFVNNSVINIEGGMTAGAPMEIVYEGNRYSGKTHGQLSSYIYKNNISATYNTLRIARVTIMSTTDADYITDTASLKQFGTPYAPAATEWFPNGVNVNTSKPSAPGYGRFYYSAGHFYGTYEGILQQLPENSNVTIADSTAADVATLVADFNNLVAALKTAHVIK